MSIDDKFDREVPYICMHIQESLKRIREGIGDKEYEASLAYTLLERIPSPSKEIYKQKIDETVKKYGLSSRSI